MAKSYTYYQITMTITITEDWLFHFWPFTVMWQTVVAVWKGMRDLESQKLHQEKLQRISDKMKKEEPLAGAIHDALMKGKLDE